MRRIFGDFAYGEGPRQGCWWDETVSIPQSPSLDGDLSVDIAVVGGGFTGISAALHLAQHGVSVAVLETNEFGWGASGRNGGFCCLGGGLAEDDALDARYSRTARLAFRRAEKKAVQFVESLIDTHGWDVDKHSSGETELAHRPKDMETLRGRASRISENYQVHATLFEQADLAQEGLNAGPFYGAMTVPIGFALNPRKYLRGMLGEARLAGAALFSKSPVTSISRHGLGIRLECNGRIVNAGQVILATNAYSSEDVPGWMAGRYMPTQSTVLVTRVLTETELHAQGWWSDQMCFDTRHLLHYFRLLPDRRFLFGMRGGLLTGPRAEQAARAKTNAHFKQMFPNWAHVEVSHSWSGMVSLARRKLPFVGELPSNPGIWAAMCYHGNGVAMGSYAGKLVADMAMARETADCPQIMRTPLSRFPFGRARRLIMPPIYGALMYKDAL